MSYLTIFFSVIAAVSINAPLNASFFKNISSWVFGQDSTRSFREIECNPHGTIIIENGNGSIVAQGWALSAAAIEVIVTGPRDLLDNVTVVYSCIPSTVRVHTRYKEDNPLIEVTYNVMVPRHAHLIFKNQSGDISVKQCGGPLSVIAHKGNVMLQEVGGPLVIHASHTITAVLCTIAHQPSELVSRHAGIILSLPCSADINVVAESVNGFISSEQKITVSPQTLKLNADTWRLARRSIRGVMGQGGSSYTLQAYGDIQLIEK